MAGDGDLPGPSWPPPDPADRPWIHPSELPAPLPSVRERRLGRVAFPVATGAAGALVALGAAALVWGPARHDGGQRPGRRSPSPVATPASLQSPGPGDPIAASRIAGAASPAVVELRAAHGSQVASGSAVVFRSDGLLVTSAGLVDGATAVAAVGPGGELVPANVVGTDYADDLALVRADLSGIKAVTLGDSGSLRVGDPCVLVGAGGTRQEGPTVAVGVVSALGKVVGDDRGWQVGVIQVDGSLAPSGTGSAVFDLRGALVGLVSSAGSGDPGRPIFAIPVATVKRSVEQLLERGWVENAWLGVSATDVSETLTATTGPLGATAGALVLDVAHGSPAERAGVRPGDVIVSFDHAPVNGMARLMRLVRDRRVGDRVDLELVRERVRRQVAVTLGDLPDNATGQG